MRARVRSKDLQKADTMAPQINKKLNLIANENNTKNQWNEEEDTAPILEEKIQEYYKRLQKRKSERYISVKF